MKPNIKTRLDTVFSQYIRQRDSNDEGFGQCIVCRRHIHWKQAHNGHYEKRRHLATRWDEKNCNLICPECNGRDSISEHSIGMLVKYGSEILEELRDKVNKGAKFSDAEGLEMIKLYKEKIKQL